MDMIGDVKCYHCGHISGQVEGRKTADRLVFHTFEPRDGYEGKVPKAGDTIRCERCKGPVFLEELRRKPQNPLAIPMPKAEANKKRSKRPKKAA